MVRNPRRLKAARGRAQRFEIGAIEAIGLLATVAVTVYITRISNRALKAVS
jgi:hypothetical protein